MPKLSGYYESCNTKVDLNDKKFGKLDFENECDAVKAFLEENPVEIDPKGSKIIDFFTGKNVFITGGTGFLGKLLIEKLLRSCENIGGIYLLLRGKKGKTFASRLDEIFDDVVFGPLQDIRPKFRYKIMGIQGDVSTPGLGLSNSDRQTLIDNIDVIFHVAATTKFDEKIRMATAINVKGTMEAMNLGKACKHLKSIVYVGTAYSNCPRLYIDECFYEPSITYESLLDKLDKYSDRTLEEILPSLLGEWPNTYAMTKAVSENAVKNYSKGLPMCIYRPSIVIATYKEPIKSWVDNFFGPTGMIVGCGTGLVHVIYGNMEAKPHIVPGDYVTNGLIAAAYKTAMDRPRNVPIYNYVNTENELTWRDFMIKNEKYGIDIPTVRAIWYYALVTTSNFYIYQILKFFLHLLPAFFIDIVLSILGNKLRMMRAYNKIHKFSDAVLYFSTKTWVFKNENVKNLWKSLGEEDKRAFPFSMQEIDWEEHAKTQILGCRVYKLQEGLETLPEGRKKWKILYVLHKTVQIVVFYIVFRIIYFIVSQFL